MAIKLNATKANFVIDLLKANGNTFTPNQLLKVTGNERRARSALSHARMAGIKLEAVRDGGKAVVSYRTVSTPTALAVAPKAKASKARTKTVTAKQISSEVDAIVARNKAPSKKSNEAVKAANLKTMRAVSAKQKAQRIEDRLTPEQRAIRESFYASEAEIAAEEKSAARASVQEYLKRETYSE